MNSIGRPSLYYEVRNRLYFFAEIPDVMRLLARALVGGASITCTLVAPSTAQTLDDALRFSELGTFGTARSLGTGNSMGAIGAEWTALQSNPAGLAGFRRNELSITLGGIQASTNSGTIRTVSGENQSVTLDDREFDPEGGDFRVVLPQIAAVFTREPIGSQWTQFNFGIGVAQTRRQEENILFSGATPGSITDRFLEISNNFYEGGDNFPYTPDELIDFFPFQEELALRSGAIFELAEPTEFERYGSDYDDVGRDSDTDPGAALLKTGDISRRGRNASVDLSIGANYDEKLLIGATLGVVNSLFEENNLYQELDPNDEIPIFEELTYRQNLRTTGTGILGRFGAIYRASQALRVGLAFHTPTVTFADESYSTSLGYRGVSAGTPFIGDASSPEAAQVEYRFRSPAQLRASAAVILGKRGFVSAEVARINYAGGKFTINDEFDTDGSFAGDLNGLIKSNLRANYQYRLGGEVNLSPVQLRAGYEYTGTPFESVGGETENPTQRFSAGVGWRAGRLGLDLGYQHTRSADRIYRPYTTQIIEFPSPQVTYTPTLNTFALTVGYKLGRR